LKYRKVKANLVFFTLVNDQGLHGALVVAHESKKGLRMH